jgi:hypothetical protein
MINRATHSTCKNLAHYSSYSVHESPSGLRYDNSTRKSTSIKDEMKIIEIQRSGEHGGLRPLERHHRLDSRRTGLFYNIKEGG